MINLTKLIFSSWLLSTGNSLQTTNSISNKNSIFVPPQINPSASCDLPYSFQYPTTSSSYPYDPLTQDFISPKTTLFSDSIDEGADLDEICEQNDQLSSLIAESFQRSIKGQTAYPEDVKILTTAEKAGAQKFLKKYLIKKSWETEKSNNKNLKELVGLGFPSSSIPCWYELVCFCKQFLLLNNADATEDFMQLSVDARKKIIQMYSEALELTGFLRIKDINALGELRMLHGQAQSTALLNVDNFITLKENHLIDEISELHPSFQKAIIEWPQNYKSLKHSNALEYISSDGDYYYYATICMNPSSILQLKLENALRFLSLQPIHVQVKAMEFPERLLFLKKNNAMEDIALLPPHIRHIAIVYPESFILLQKENVLETLEQFNEKECQLIFKNPEKFLRQKSCTETIFNRECISRSFNPLSYM